MTLTIGQSLTPEQVRELPDGAKVLLDWGIMYKDVFTAPIQNTMTGENGRIAVMLLSIAGWHSATLVSLPTAELQPDPSPGEGYRWVEAGKNLRHGDEWKMTDGPWILWTVDCGDVSDGTYRRRIEPQADPEPTPCASSEIEKEAARALLHKAAEVVKTHSNSANMGVNLALIVQQADRLLHIVSSYKDAESYARSIGAIE